jgi:Cation/multidrug efflux pump
MILVFIVVYVFLQNWRATLIPCIAVPVSIIGTFAGLFAFGYTINTLTLFALVLAIGIVVDDAIVVLENVERIMLGTLSASVGNLFTGPAGAWSYGVTGTVPVLDFGRNWYNLKDAEAQKKAAIAVYRKTVQSAFEDIRTSLTSQREADHIVRSMVSAVKGLTM